MRTFILLLIAVMTVSCGKSNPAGPSVSAEPEITNTEGKFTFTVKGFRGVTDNVSYEWLNPSPIAQVEMDSNIDWGEGTLIVSDGAGDTVFTGDLYEGGTYLTDIGTPGSWTIRVILQNASGNIDITITAVM